VSDFNRIISRFNYSVGIDQITDFFKIYVVLNTNNTVINEDMYTKLEMDIVISEFISISNKSKIEVDRTISKCNKIVGVNDFRRQMIKESQPSDYILFVDCDVYFSENILVSIKNSINKLEKNIKDFVITPSTVRLWDTTWDCVVSQKYIDQPLNFHLNIKCENVVSEFKEGYNLKPITKFKWGGGWFTLVPRKLAHYIGIPSSFVGYGVDDTFMMVGCLLLKKSGIKVQQYVLTNTLVCEDNKAKNNIKYFHTKTDKLRCKSESGFDTEITKLKNKIKKTPYI
jgi:hypothetical protein